MALIDLLLIALSVFAARAFWRLIEGVMDGLSGRPSGSGGPVRRRRSGGVPEVGVQMARDPVCGTYVVPDHAVSLNEGRSRVFFCSTTCRDKYRAHGAKSA